MFKWIVYFYEAVIFDIAIQRILVDRDKPKI